MEYLDYYGLEFDPFELPVDAVFSTAGGRGQLLEKIEHLVAFSELNIFIYGQQGIGKTNFLKNLVSAPSTMWKSVYLPITYETKLDDILKLILSEYQLTLSKNASLEVFSAEICENLQSDGSSILLLCFDDAHLLNSEIFDQLAKLSIFFNKFEIQLKVLFAGEQDGLEGNCHYAEDSKQSYHLFLSALDLVQTQSYLTVYFQKAGRSEKIPLSSADVKRIYEMTQGVPAKINQLTPEYLIQSLDHPINGFRFPVVKVATGLVGLILLISLFYYKQYETTESKNTTTLTAQMAPVEIIKKEDVLAKANSVIAKLEQATEHQEILESNFIEQDLVTTFTMVDTELQVGTELKVDEIEMKAILDVTEEELDIPDETLGVEVDVLPEISVEPELISESEVDTPETSVEPKVKDNDWFKSNAGWVVQVLGSYNEQSIDDFILDNKQFDWHKYHRNLKGKPYFVLVFGAFDTKAQATGALSVAPKSIREMQTWTRSIESIRPLLAP